MVRGGEGVSTIVPATVLWSDATMSIVTFAERAVSSVQSSDRHHAVRRRRGPSARTTGFRYSTLR